MGATDTQTILGGKRFYIAVFLFFNLLINYIDRVNLSVAAPALAKDFHWDPARMGWVLSAYLWTYTICLIPTGALLDRFGARRVGAIGITVWSAAATLTGVVTGFVTMCMARLGLGMGEATTFPVAGKVIRQWFPVKERGFAWAVFHSGAHAAPALATPIVAWLVVRSGWRASFAILGVLGLIWLMFWLWRYREPEECTWLSAEEQQFILEHRDVGSAPIQASRDRAGKVFSTLLRQRTMWGVMLTQGCSTYFNYLFLAWLPTYLVQVRGLHLVKAGVYTAIPNMVAVVVVLGCGKLSDRFLAAESIKKGKRRNVVIVLFLLCTVIMLINVVQSERAVLVVLALAMSFNLTCLTLNLALTSDLIEDAQMAGTVFAMVSTSANLFGLCAPVVTGYIIKSTGSFSAAFDVSGAVVIVAALMSFTLIRRPIHGPVQTGNGAEVPVT
jgi:ACS family glucarate transporter-like MFS transporter